MRFSAWLLVLALCSGALLPLQAAANATMSKSLGSVACAALVLFTVGLLFVIGCVLLTRATLPPLATFTATPSWSYLGGLIVSFYVLTITYAAPRLGVGTAISIIFVGQIISSVLIDHFGWLRAPVTPVSWGRFLGVLLMLAGVLLAKRP